MSKVLVDRELLERAMYAKDGKELIAANRELRAILDKPAEAEGVRDYLTELAEGEVEAKTAIEELQDALSAVTAERDRLLVDLERAHRATNSECMDWAREYERRKEVQAERDQLRAEVEVMRAQRDKMAQILRDLVPGCKWRFMRPRIDQALQEVDGGN